MASVGAGSSTQELVAAAVAAAQASKVRAAQNPRVHPVSRLRDDRLVALQAKLDILYPPFEDVNGVWVAHEFEAAIPLPGERYFGEGCARCMVPGCDRFGRLFHLKNLMTHGAPRGGQMSKNTGSVTHKEALSALLGYRPATPPRPPDGEVKRRMSKKAKSELEALQSGREIQGATNQFLNANPEARKNYQKALEATYKQSLTASGAEAAAMDASQFLAEREATKLAVKAARANERSVPGYKQSAARHHEMSYNFSGYDANFIYYRNMKLPLTKAQVLLVRRVKLGYNPSQNVKFLGNLSGARDEWEAPLEAAQARARSAGLHLSLVTQYDQLHLDFEGGVDSNHCLHLYVAAGTSTRRPTSGIPHHPCSALSLLLSLLLCLPFYVLTPSGVMDDRHGACCAGTITTGRAARR